VAYTDIDKSDDYFNTKLYTGTGSSNSITGVGFQPDMVWLKSRSNGNYHNLQDAVRGANKVIYPNDTSAEATSTTRITSFNSDGFTVGTESDVNGSSRTYVSWNWLGANGTASNTNGSITSTVSANTTSGFSIATWSGTGSNGSVGHGLGGVDFMIIKDLSNSRNWYTWNKTFAYDDRIKLDTTSAKETGTDNMTALPDSTKINMATSTQNNGSGNNYVGYFFQEKKGFSKFGSYQGNSDSNGPFIYLGFKPAMVIVKDSTSTGQWFMRDNKRDTYNAAVKTLYANSEGVEEDAQPWDMLSNGFKMRNTDADLNNSSQTYIFMAFAENPLVTSTGIPTTAR